MGALTTVIEPWMPIFPAHTVRRLRYSGTASLSSTSGVVAGYVLRANDLFDPDFTSTGRQPMGFDQMIAFYNHFVVLKARLVVTFVNTGSSTSPTVCIRQDADSTIITNFDQIKEFGGCVYEQLEAKGSYGQNKVLELSVDIAKLQGVNRQAIVADTALQGNAGASPSEVTFLHMLLWDATNTTSAASAQFVLEQEAVFIEPRDLTQSLERKHTSHTCNNKSGVCR